MTRSKLFCCAKNCYNYQQAPNAPKFFNFPKDLVSRAQWAENAGRPDLITKSYASFLGRYFLCADHFESHCFICPVKKDMFKRDINPMPTIFENNISNVLTIKNTKMTEECPVSGIATLATAISLDCPGNIAMDMSGSELSSIVTVDLSPENLLCSLDGEVNDVAITDVTPTDSAEDALQMECLMLCRLCASLIEISVLSPIFNDSTIPSINQMIERFLPGKVQLEDGLPQHICSSCMERLRVCFESVELFQSADSRLREMLQLCSLSGDSVKLNETSEAVISTFNLAPSDKNENCNLNETSALLTTVGLLPIAEKSGDVEDDQVPSNVIAVLDVANEATELSENAEDIAASCDELDMSRTACNVCLKTLPSRGDLFLHYVSTHTVVLKGSSEESVSFQCTICEEVIGSKKGLKQHLSSHIPSEYLSVKSDKRFKSWASLQNHNQTCNETVLPNSNPKHSSVALDKKSDKGLLECSECGKECRSRTSLKKHVSIHSSDRNVLCSLCGKVLANLNSLRVHMRTHTDDRPFSCQECGKSFKGSTELRTHSITHTREKVFECSECGRKFHSKSLVRQHLLSHTREKPHKCNFCPAAFNRLGNLNQHKKKHANSRNIVDVTHECTVCGKRFQSELTLKYHVAKHTGEKHPFDCGVCGKRFIAIDPYRVHMRIHSGERPYECSVCKKTFRSSATLKQHTVLHRDDFPFACPFCQRSFKRLQSLIVHKKTHTGEKPYPCPLCGRPFAQKGDMLKHTKTHRTQPEGESVIMEINSIHDLNLSETDITSEFLMGMPIVKVEMT